MIQIARPRPTRARPIADAPPRSAKTPRRAKPTPGLLAHRLFPGLAALWFAALFGLGGLVAAADALGALVVHLHLPAILPAAAPPLGLTARVLTALVLAGLGGAIGLALGVVLYARAGGVLPQRPQRAAPEEDLQPARARWFKPDADAVDAQAPRVRSRDAHPDAPPRRPLVVSDDVLPYAADIFEPAPPTPAPIVVMPAEIRPTDAFAAEQNHLARDGSAPEPDEPAHDLPPFLAAAWPATQRDDAAIIIPSIDPIMVPVAPEPVAVAAPAAPINMPPLASLAAAAPQPPLRDVPLASLGLVQLIERLALAIATRQSRLGAVPSPTTAAVDPLVPLHRFDPLRVDPDGPLLRAKPARFETPSMPQSDALAVETLHPAHAPFDPLANADDWADDDFADDPAPRFPGTPATPVADTGADGAIVEHRYSSLVGMALPRPELLPHDLVHHYNDHGQAAPVVQFPQRPSSNDRSAPDLAPTEADRALRDALAILRRMSAQR